SGGTANVVPANAAPTIATATITGTATQGQTLTAGYTGLTGYPTPTVTYQWYSNGVAISGATGSTFLLGVAQVGTVMTVRATATNSSGNASATSTGTSSVIYANAAPTISTATASGSMLVGTTLSAVATGVTGYPAPTATYQWFADGSAISGATASTFTITVSQLGAVITVTITETNSSGTASATSVGGSAVTYPNAAPAIASASITGTTTVGQTLTAGSTGVTGWPVPTLSYQWFANGSPISGATGSTFVLTSGQIGAVITVRVTASNGIGSAASATSPGTSSVIPANSAPVIASAAVTGTTTVGQALTCTPSGVAGYPAPTVTYQWYAGGVAISGATSATFTLTSTQVGLAITCVATATNSSGAATATSNATSNVVPANAAPTIATATITGTATQGQTLTAGYTGLTGYPTPTVTYQWYANGVAISGATNSSFVLGVAQVGAVITVRATATNSSGSASAVSSATATVGYANAAPTIATATASGALLVGSTLTAGATGVTGYPAPTATYQWYANGVAISGATASTYVLTSAEVGAVITVEVTETNAFGTASAISNGGAAVNYPNLAPGIATATITGTPTVGQTLTSGYTGVTGFPTPTLSYQWLANGVVISGATGTTFVVTSAQVGMAITVRIAASNGVGSAAFATSSPTSTVSPANAAPAIGGATITGTPTVGQTLTCTPTGVTGYPAPTLTYQWYAGGVAISGATAATFLLTGGQVGAAITCVVTATNGVGSAATATSGATSNVAAAPVAASSYAIVASAGSNGTITPAGVTNVAAGANQTYRITPALGYQIDTILVDGVIVANANTYAFVTVVDTHTIKVTFISIVLANAPVPVELGPGSSIATHNGQAVPVTVTPNSTNNGVIITGDGWSLTLQGIDAAGNPIPLTADGKLILTPGQFAAIVGTGFSPNTPAIVWIFSSPVQLGQFTVDASGNFSGVMPIPTTISVGNHTAVVQGVGTAGENRQANLGVIVGALPVVSTVTFAGDSAALNAQALAALKAIATTVKKSAPASTPVTITVKGWVAPTASTANDAALSLARANAAKTALQKLGVKATFVVSGQGVWDVGTGPAKKAQITVTFGKKN
ncbi:MAG: beta strand repeat-containing protein, partial [Micrococcales bacterium]